MAVTVILERFSGGQPNGTETYKDGGSFVVKDGHLVVNGPAAGMSTPTLAIYAPGSWLAAHKDDERVFAAMA